MDWATPGVRAAVTEKAGVVAYRREDYQRALVHYRRAASQYRSLGAVRQEASVTRGIGMTLYAAGELQEARSVLARAVVTAQSMENLAGEAEARFGLGEVELALHNHNNGIRQLAQAARLFREVGQTDQAATVEREIRELRGEPP